MKIRILLTAASLTMAAPLVASDTAPIARTFEHDGTRYSYTITTRGDARILTGIVEDSGKPFRLEVINGRVRGTVNGKAVAFSMRDVKPFRQRTEIAAR